MGQQYLRTANLPYRHATSCSQDSAGESRPNTAFRAATLGEFWLESTRDVLVPAPITRAEVKMSPWHERDYSGSKWGGGALNGSNNAILEFELLFECGCPERHWLFQASVPQAGSRCPNSHSFRLKEHIAIRRSPRQGFKNTSEVDWGNIVWMAQEALGENSDITQRLLLQTLHWNHADAFGAQARNFTFLMNIMFWLVELHGTQALVSCFQQADALNASVAGSPDFWTMHVDFPWVDYVSPGGQHRQLRLTTTDYERALSQIEATELRSEAANVLEDSFDFEARLMALEGLCREDPNLLSEVLVELTVIDSMDWDGFSSDECRRYETRLKPPPAPILRPNPLPTGTGREKYRDISLPAQPGGSGWYRGPGRGWSGQWHLR